MSNRKSTRNAQGGGSIRKRKDGRWEARYTTGRDPGTGKQVQKSVYGATQKEVRQKLQQATTAIDEGIFMEPSKMTVGNWLDLWMDEYTGNVKDTTARSYKDNIRLHIKPALGAVPLQRLSPHTIQGFYNNLAENGHAMQKGQKNNAPAGLSAKSIRNIHAIFHKALKQALLVGYLKTNPTEGCILPRAEKKEMKIFQEDEVAAFMKAVEDHKNKALYLTKLFTGMRRGEVLGLTWDCVDFASGSILINKQLQRERIKGGQLRLVPLKNDKQRRVTPPDTVFQLLREHKCKQSETRLLVGPVWANKGLVFTNDVGGFLDADAVYKAYKRLLANNGLPDIRMHDLRHTAATLMLQNGDDIKTVQEALGHHTAAFTLDVYGHVTEKMKRYSADRMEAFINSVQKGG
ncbi:MAG: site-specific integrase [Clostridiales bacterium]|nr:site-specific integrase [Clostridiales bacterium]